MIFLGNKRLSLLTKVPPCPEGEWGIRLAELAIFEERCRITLTKAIAVQLYEVMKDSSIVLGYLEFEAF